MKRSANKKWKKASIVALTMSVITSTIVPMLPTSIAIAKSTGKATLPSTYLSGAELLSTGSNTKANQSVLFSSGANFITAASELSVFVRNGKAEFISKYHLYPGDNLSYAIQPKWINNEKIVKADATSGIIPEVFLLTETGKVYRFYLDDYYENWERELIYENPDIVDIAANGSTLNVLLKDGTVRVSGLNTYGDFANGLQGKGGLGDCITYLDKTRSFADTHQVLTSATYSACSSNNSYKQLVTGTPLSNVKQIFSPPNESKVIALTNNNELYYWGTNAVLFATKLNGSTSFRIKEAVLGDYPVFLTEDGKVYYYPKMSGQPVQITLANSSAKAIKLMTSGDGTLILTDDGKLYGFGNNSAQNLGPNIPRDGYDINTTKVAAYTGISNVQDVAMGTRHTIIHLNDGTYAGLGKSTEVLGQYKSKTSQLSSFTKVTGLKNVTDVMAGYDASYASTSDNQFYSWGGDITNNILGGNARITRGNDPSIPGLVKDFSDSGTIVSIDGSPGYTVDDYQGGGILLSDGSYWNFAATSVDYFYEHGLVTGHNNRDYFALDKVQNYNTSTGPGKIASAAQDATGGIALGNDGKLYSWGYGSGGALGNGSSSSTYARSYTTVTMPSGVTFSKVYAGYDSRAAISSNGDVYVWGSNRNNRLGVTGSSITTPTKVSGLPAIQGVAFGRDFTLFLDTSGNVWSVGLGSKGSLGLGNTTNQTTPIQIPSLSKVSKIAAGYYDSFAITETGKVYAWGYNQKGTLGLGHQNQTNTPQLVPGISNAKEVSVGYNHTLLVTSTGELYATGDNSKQQLGLGYSTNSTAELIPFPFGIKHSLSSYETVFQESDFVSLSVSFYTYTSNTPFIEYTYRVEAEDGTIMIPTTTDSLLSPFPTDWTYIEFTLDNFPPGSYTLISTAKDEFDGSMNTEVFEFTVIGFTKELPSIIEFPSITLDPSNNTATPSYMDIEHLIYDDPANPSTTYSISLSVSDFTSASGNTFSPSFVWKNVQQLNRSGSVIKPFDELTISSTPVELVSTSDTASEPFTHLKMPKSGLELSIPLDIYLENGSETFEATFVWDIALTP